MPYSDFPSYYLCLLLVAGLWLLSYGGDWMARGAASLALKLKINPVVVGLTVVSIATSMPELITTLVATGNNSPGLAIGNIVGSNICNIGLILGVAAVIAPLQIQSRLIRLEAPILLLVTGVFFLFCFSLTGDGSIARWEGILLLCATVGYLFYMVRGARHGMESPGDVVAEELQEAVSSLKAIIILLAAGAIGLAIGAELVYQSSVIIAQRLNISETLIGLTIVAIGTSLPELAASIAAALRRQSDIVAGNIVGSNIFNILLIGGSVGTVYELDVTATLFRIEFPAMIFLTVMLWWTFWTDKTVSRREGIALLVLYSAILLISAFTQSGSGGG